MKKQKRTNNKHYTLLEKEEEIRIETKNNEVSIKEEAKLQRNRLHKKKCSVNDKQCNTDSVRIRALEVLLSKCCKSEK